VTTSELALEMGLTQTVRYRTGTVTGADPVLMLTGPIPATEKVLGKSGLRVDEVGVFEVNEAFAPVPLAWLAETGADPERLNPLGGAIALGHPLGATGARQIATALHELERRKGRYAVITMCVGGGMGAAGLIERAA
jgi:acetyl-CoA acyltransferase